MKKCPFCAEEIQSEAIKCKHCGEWLPKPAASPLSEVQTEDQSIAAPGSFAAPAPVALAIPRASFSQLFWSWLIATWILGSYQLKALSNPDVPRVIFWLALGLVALNAAIAVSFIATLRSAGDNPQLISIWGLAWRAVLATFASVLVKILVQGLLPIDSARAAFSVGNIVIWEVISLLAILIAAWALFSHNRRNQFRSMFAAIRGY